MKWPTEVTIVRHAQSAYNVLRDKKDADYEYLEFKRFFDKDPEGGRAKELAQIIMDRYALGVGDYETPLTEDGREQARVTGRNLSLNISLPDVILCSPYERTRNTLDEIRSQWTGLGDVRVVMEDRIREQEHGLALLYNDWRVFHVFHPEQRKLRELLGPYWYQFPQGESVSMVRDRVRSLLSTITREYSGQRILLVTHHLTILSIRAILERLSPEEFIHLDEVEKPVNCGVTFYKGNPTEGKRGRLERLFYNRKWY